MFKVLLEGAQFESRQGNTDQAMALLKYIRENYPGLSPIFLESSKMEERRNNLKEAI